jgi:hypothetical protein
MGHLIEIDIKTFNKQDEMPPRVTNSIDSHAYIKAFEKLVKC